jgi:hypothetical protein
MFRDKDHEASESVLTDLIDQMDEVMVHKAMGRKKQPEMAQALAPEMEGGEDLDVALPVPMASAPTQEDDIDEETILQLLKEHQMA